MFKKIVAVAFKINEYCNLDCEYCFQKKDIKTHHEGFTDFDTLTKFLSTLPIDNELEFKVTGGESSLFINDIRNAFLKLRKLERLVDTKIRFTTISNGTNIDGLISLMDENILTSWGCKISWDGIHSASKSRFPKNPKYTDEYFNNIISKIGKSKYNKDILVRIAATENTIDDLSESFKYALEQGCRKIEYYFLSDYDKYKDDKFAIKFERQLANIISLKNEYHFIFPNWEILFFTENCLEEKDKLRSIACRHLGRMLYIENSGLIAPCGYFSNDSIFSGETWHLGNIYQGFNKKEVEKFIKQYKDAPMCNYKECYNLHCFECPAVNKYRSDKMSSKLCQTCRLRDIERSLYKIYSVRETVSEEDKKRIMNNFHYTRDWENLNYDIPNLPYF